LSVSRRADLVTLVVAVVVHVGFAVAIAREHGGKHPATSTVELVFAKQTPAVAAVHPAAAAGPSHAASAVPKPRRQLALRPRAVPASHPAPETAATPATPTPAPQRPIFAVSMASTTEVSSGVSVPIAAAAGAAAPRPGGAAAGRAGGSASSGDGEGAYQPASESDVGTMPEIDTDACGKTIAYPDEATQAGIEGDVRLRVALTPEGHVYAVHVLAGLGHGLDRAATEALKHRCRFSPAIGKGGKPVAFVIQSYTFHFQLPR
jgi:protein TonB